MAIETKIFLTCDTPGCYMRHEHGNTEAGLLKSAKKHGWEIKDGKHRCIICVEKKKNIKKCDFRVPDIPRKGEWKEKTVDKI